MNTYGDSQPTKEYFSIYTRRDGTTVAYRRTMYEYNRYIALYGDHPKECRWCYEEDIPPDAIVFG